MRSVFLLFVKQWHRLAWQNLCVYLKTFSRRTASVSMTNPTGTIESDLEQCDVTNLIDTALTRINHSVLVLGDLQMRLNEASDPQREKLKQLKTSLGNLIHWIDELQRIQLVRAECLTYDLETNMP